MAPKNKPNELYIERIFDAPLKMVWDAWVDPQQVAQWWGPRGFTITSHSKDVRTGGHWKYTMHGPDGIDYPAQTKKFIKKAGGNSTWDRLAEYLEMESNNQDIFIINQSFDAPINLMFEMWTDPQHLAHWTGPAGSETKFIRAEIKPGARGAFYSMTGVGGTKIYGKANYLEIEKPHRIVYTQSFCDENKNITRHPMAPTWPEVMKTTVLLEAEGPDKTRVTLKWEVGENATLLERETFNKAKTGMSQGWGGSFDNLDAYLNKQ